MYPMKRVIALALSLLLLLFPAAPAEELPEDVPEAVSAAGDWYADLNGVPLRLTLDPDGSYERALPSALGGPVRGAWEERDGFVILDGDMSSPLDLVSGTFMTGAGGGLCFTREAPRTYVPADISENVTAPFRDGYWVCAYADADGPALPARALGETSDLYIEGTAVALGGPRFGDVFYRFEEADGALSAEVNGARVTIALQKDGLLRLNVSGESGITLYLARAAAEG